MEKLMRLSMLAMTDAERQAMQAHLHNMQAFVSELFAWPMDADTEPLFHPTEGATRLRTDTAGAQVDREHMQACAPEVAHGFYMVPKVVD